MRVSAQEPNESMKDYAMRVIRDAIVHWDLAPGMLVSEHKLAEELGISRLPVREALKELAKTRIVETYPQRGTRIAPLDYTLVDEAEFVRRIIESAVMELACELATQEDFDWLEDQLQQQVIAQQNGDADLFQQLDLAYHRYYYEISRKQQCFNWVQDLGIHFERVRHIGYINVAHSSLVEDHQAIFLAVKQRNPEKAKAFLLHHLRHYKDEREIAEKLSRDLLIHGS